MTSVQRDLLQAPLPAQSNMMGTPMNNSALTFQANLRPRPWGALLAVVAALVLSVPCARAMAQDEATGDDVDQDEAVELADEDLECLSCHDKPGFETKLKSGETISLEISTQDYLGSMHNENSCTDCHSEIDTDTHGTEDAVTITSKRELGVSMRDACVDCHKKKYKEYDDSVHAALIAQGSDKAPMCADCHNPHTVRAWKVAESEAAMPCGKCHAEIFEASAKDVHGRARGARENPAPVCAGCHKAHSVQAASLGNTMRDTCLTCHENAVEQHKVWLPNTQRHFDAISCPACHAPDAQRRVNLRLYRSSGDGSQQLSEQSGVPRFEQRTLAADAKDVGLDDRELWTLLDKFGKDSADGKTVLRGRLEVSSGVAAHQLADKSKAIGDCNACHQAGAQPFQSVTLTIAGPDGRPLRHEVQKGVLNSLLSVNSVQGFYVLGSTRIKLLDILLVLMVLGSIGGPLAHMTVKWLLKRARSKRSATAPATTSDATEKASADSRDGNNDQR
jgi:hypothetical protein